VSIVHPKSPQVARDLLALAAEHGYESRDVRARDDAFEVPDALGDLYAASLITEAPPAKKAPARKTDKE
jgi:hypothetical protein